MAASAFCVPSRAAGVQPILGLELQARAPAGLPQAAGALVLLAMELSGWSSLCRLSSCLQMQPAGESFPALTFEQLALYRQGLICMTGGAEGLISRWAQAGEQGQALRLLEHLQELYPDRLYVEVDGN